MLRGMFVGLIVVVACSTSIAGDAVRGKQRFNALCGACHSVDAGQRKISAHLKGIVGRKAGSVPGVAYSTALKTSNWVWSVSKLQSYLADPKKSMPGTTMMVAADDATDRSDIIAYLGTLN